MSRSPSAQAARTSVIGHAWRVLPADNTVQPALETGLGLSFSLTRTTSVWAEYSHARHKVRDDPGRLIEGRLTLDPIVIGGMQKFLEKSRFSPFFVLGLGPLFAKYRGEFVTIPEVQIRHKISTGLLICAGVGVDVSLGEFLSLIATGGYRYRRAKGTTTTTDMNFGVTTDTFTIDLSAWEVGFGFRLIL